jgi:hypothetical protein
LEFAGTGHPLSRQGFENGREVLGINLSAFWAVMTVETRGFGFLVDRRPKILFERHIFSERTGSKFDANHPAISNPKSGGYGAGGANQYTRLGEAIQLDRVAALESASWGLGQVMGFNAESAGSTDVEALVSAMSLSEDAQMMAMVSFIHSNNLAKHLRNKDWVKFARAYNGEGYRKNDYDTKLAQAYALYDTGAVPDLDVRALQASLVYLGFDPKGVDGVFGSGSQKALIAYQKSRKLPQDGRFTKVILDKVLQEAFPN